MIHDLHHCCNERLTLGQSDIKQLADRLASLNESECESVCYSECRKPIVNKKLIERLRGKRAWSNDSPACPAPGPRRPSSTETSARPKRKK